MIPSSMALVYFVVGGFVSFIGWLVKSWEIMQLGRAIVIVFGLIYLCFKYKEASNDKKRRMENRST